MAHAINSPSPEIPMRITRLFGTVVRIDRYLRKVGLRLPLKVVAWAAGRSIQAFICGNWITIKIDPGEVMANACG